MAAEADRDEEKRYNPLLSVAGKILLTIAGLSVCYVLSVGPAMWARHKHVIGNRSSTAQVLGTFYQPLYYLMEHVHPFGWVVMRYIDMWTDGTGWML